MCWRQVPSHIVAGLVAVTLLGQAPATMAGEHVRAPTSASYNSASASAAPARPSSTAASAYARTGLPSVRIVYSIPYAQPPDAAAPPVYVDIRQPDGTVRTVPLEGGRDVIQTQEVVVRAGQSVTIQFPAPARTK
jgi:hypothetical protein